MFTQKLMRHWLGIAIAAWGIYNALPWLTPALMHAGLTGPGRVLYTFYSLVCHQLPERSYFLFGAQPMYSLPEIQAAYVPTNDPLILRQFTGNLQMGWKVAWSDRMISLYTGMWLAMVVYALVRRRTNPLPPWAFVLLLVPMGLDGGTHMLSDLLGGGVGQGFRDANVWLATLTGNALPAWFYAGDALGSFNWWMRLATGLLMAFAIVWLTFPYLDRAMEETLHPVEERASP